MTDTVNANVANADLETIAAQSATGYYLDTILNRSKLIWHRDR